MRKALLILILITTSTFAGPKDVKNKLGDEVQVEGFFVSVWEKSETGEIELQIRFPRNWEVEDFDREWPSWQGDMRGFSATFRTPEGGETIFFGKALRQKWPELVRHRESRLTFEEGIIRLYKISWQKIR